MKLYFLSQSTNNGYDTFNACVVAATSADKARLITPSEADSGSWADPRWVYVSYLGTAKRGTKAGIVLASFNAG
jgi:hypothetical protein